MIPDELDARLRLEARRRDASIAEVAREALEGYLRASGKGGRLSFFGVGEGRPRDVARRVDEFVGKAIAGRRPARAPRAHR